MRNCPRCGYGNPDTDVKCGICGRDMANTPVKAEPVPEKKSGLCRRPIAMIGSRPSLLFFAGLLLAVCGALFFSMENSPWRKETSPESGVSRSVRDGTGQYSSFPTPLPGVERSDTIQRSDGSAAADENYFSYAGVLYGLDKMSALRFLPEADRRKLPPLLSSPEDKVAYAAAKVIGAWSRAEADEALRRLWFETLLKTASSGRPVVRWQAASEAGLTVVLGFPVLPYLERVRQAAAGLVAQKETELKAAGFFLSAMAGLEDFAGQMRETLLHDPSSSARLYAACALSRLGRAEGHGYLLRAVSEKDPAIRSEAVSCLSYSASPEAERLLLSISKDGLDAASAEAAKRGLILRRQLAIIKK